MIAELREMLKLDELNLNYEIKIADFDGENFSYTVTESDYGAESLLEKVREALDDLLANPECGYIDAYAEDKVRVYQDTGNCENPLQAVHMLLCTFNEVSGIKEVIINEM